MVEIAMKHEQSISSSECLRLKLTRTQQKTFQLIIKILLSSTIQNQPRPANDTSNSPIVLGDSEETILLLFADNEQRRAHLHHVCSKTTLPLLVWIPSMSHNFTISASIADILSVSFQFLFSFLVTAAVKIPVAVAVEVLSSTTLHPKP